MNEKRDSQFRIALGFGIIISMIIVISFYFIPSRKEHGGVDGVDGQFSILLSDERMSVFDLIVADNFEKMHKDERLTTKRKYAYLAVRLTNSNPYNENIVLYNQNWNYYVELLTPEKNSAVTLYRYGDEVPLRESPFRHVKAGFPVHVDAGGTYSCFIEYYSPTGLIVNPVLLKYPEFLDRISSERLFIGSICGIFIFLIFLNAVNGVMLNGLYFFPAVAFIGSVFFFFLRQSRVLLLLMDTWTYPEWLFALSIGLNTISVSIFTYFLMRRYFNRPVKFFLQLIVASTAVLISVSIFTAPFAIAKILNVLSLFVLVPAGYGLAVSLIRKERFTLYVVFSFIPWLTTVVIDIFAAVSTNRLLVPVEFQQAPGMIASLILLSLTLQHLHFRRYQKDLNTVKSELEKSQVETEQKLAEVSELKYTVLHRLAYSFRQPLDSMNAVLSLVEKRFDDPQIIAASEQIAAEISSMKNLLGSEISEYEQEHAEGLEEPVLKETSINRLMADTKPWTDYSVCIFDFDPRHSARTAFLLRTSGFDVRVIAEQYQILSLVNEGKVDVLIIDPVSTGESAFSLCGMIRSEFNMLEVPILMITSYHADYLMKKGYGAGVNDFLTRPFDSSELSARIQSLIKLKRVARNNHDLARSEKEKNTFLYFLTHNINTPLTLLLNRIHELSTSGRGDMHRDLVDDLLASGSEINDIVQNILISFRLSDGRQTVRFSRLDIGGIVMDVKEDLAAKTAEKQQTVTVNISSNLPGVNADYSAVRGIIYNLIDNAVKFTPAEGQIRIDVGFDEYVSVKVSDSGPGVTDEEQSALFQRFQRLSARPTAGESSTGLGLYVAHELAAMNGGSLVYKKTSGGACFVFSLPVDNEEADG